MMGARRRNTGVRVTSTYPRSSTTGTFIIKPDVQPLINGNVSLRNGVHQFHRFQSFLYSVWSGWWHVALMEPEFEHVYHRDQSNELKWNVFWTVSDRVEVQLEVRAIVNKQRPRRSTFWCNPNTKDEISPFSKLVFRSNQVVSYLFWVSFCEHIRINTDQRARLSAGGTLPKGELSYFPVRGQRERETYEERRWRRKMSLSATRGRSILLHLHLKNRSVASVRSFTRVHTRVFSTC